MTKISVQYGRAMIIIGSTTCVLIFVLSENANKIPVKSAKIGHFFLETLYYHNKNTVKQYQMKLVIHVSIYNIPTARFGRDMHGNMSLIDFSINSQGLDV